MKSLARRMIRLLLMVPAFSWLVPARAALDVGDTAVKFSAPAALAGKPFTYSLAGALANGPVVVYYFPAAFSTGCSIEAHAFAEAIEQFAALGATVIGVSTDDLETLTKFSSQPCLGTRDGGGVYRRRSHGPMRGMSVRPGSGGVGV